MIKLIFDVIGFLNKKTVNKINIKNYRDIIGKKILFSFLIFFITLVVLVFNMIFSKNDYLIIFYSSILLFQFFKMLYFSSIYSNFKNNEEEKEERQTYNESRERIYDEFNKNSISINKSILTSAKLFGIDIKKDNNETIKKQYRILVLKWHPDRWVNDKVENQQIANRNFQKVKNAYDILKKYRNIK